MIDREKVIKGLECCSVYQKNRCEMNSCPYWVSEVCCIDELMNDALALIKEQEKKKIKLHKKHVITWKRDDEFTMRKLYEAICETLLDEGELFIARTDDHEKVEFVFYVAESR